MLTHVTPPSIEDSHLTMLPVWPLNESVPLFEPLQADEEPATVPPTDAGETVISTEVEFAEAHPPLCTTARNKLFTTRLL